MGFIPRTKDVDTDRCRQESNQDLFVNSTWVSKWARWSLAGCQEMDAVFGLFLDYAELKVPKRDAGVWVKLAPSPTSLPQVGLVVTNERKKGGGGPSCMPAAAGQSIHCSPSP